MENKRYFTYIIRCNDQSLYTGITTDLERRLNEHKYSKKLGAKYTKKHVPLYYECAWISNNRSDASKLEYYIKSLSKIQKEQLIKYCELQDVLGNKINSSNYERM